MNITIVTPTGDRPEAFALCERWVRHQTLQPVQWIVLDDGVEPTTCTAGQTVIREVAWRGAQSLVLKIRHLVTHCRIAGDAVAFIEDDDYYAPDYLAVQSERMDKAELGMVGEGCALYYSVAGRWWFQHGNMAHASLCQTVLAKEHLGTLGVLCGQRTDPFIDCRLWQKANFPRHVFHPGNKPTTIGIKCMPGRKGYGVGHSDRLRGTHADPELVKLRALIGEDAEAYRPFYCSTVSQPSTLPSPQLTASRR